MTESNGATSDEDRALIEQVERELADYDEDADDTEPLPADKTDFPLGIRPDGTVNRSEQTGR